ncbi:hypothetical protein R3P38DRAFT_2554155 [Favolaschia claudopus]|uniref:Uncharacterized protein n=1 Tax=Favolaschia claudopus TaxID=2862362 RepID=A0AAW0AFQ5_9AGAR
MFSRPDHHHQRAREHAPASPALFDASNSPIDAQSHLLTHHKHLESLLDSVLATLTLIQTTETETNSAPPYSPHSVAVFHLITRKISSQITPPRRETTPAPPAGSLFRPPNNDTAAPQPQLQHDPPLHVTRPQARERPSCVVIRFDREPAHLPRPVKRSPAALYEAASAALSSVSPNRLLAGIAWTKGDKMSLHPDLDTCTPKVLASHFETIWAAICPLLGLSDDRLEINFRLKFPPPMFDTDEKWHSVVFHGVPFPRTDLNEYITHDRVDSWITSASSKGRLREFSILSRPITANGYEIPQDTGPTSVSVFPGRCRASCSAWWLHVRRSLSSLSLPTKTSQPFTCPILMILCSHLIFLSTVHTSAHPLLRGA